MLRNLSAVTLLFFCGMVPLQAFLATESFDYVAGQLLNGKSGGAGWTSSWQEINNAADINYGGLTFPDQSTSGNAAILDNIYVEYVAYRSFAGVDANTQTSASFSYLFQLQGTVSFVGNTYAGINLFSGQNQQLFFGKLGNSEQIGIQTYVGDEEVLGVDIDWENEFAQDYVYRFDVDYELAAQGESTMSITLSRSDGEPAELLATWNDVSLGEGFNFDGVQIIRDGAMNNGIGAVFDEINISAVPEPAALSWLCGGLLLIAARRRVAA